MKSFELGDAGKILLVKQNGKLSAIGSKCTHYGAPLHTGVLGNGRVRCPWHGACFNTITGTHVRVFRVHIPYILESNPHPFYIFRGLKK
jgi:nitrite reductase/ring-hydroxylating ferredoxin subunit